MNLCLACQERQEPFLAAETSFWVSQPGSGRGGWHLRRKPKARLPSATVDGRMQETKED